MDQCNHFFLGVTYHGALESHTDRAWPAGGGRGRHHVSIRILSNVTKCTGNSSGDSSGDSSSDSSACDIIAGTCIHNSQLPGQRWI